MKFQGFVRRENIMGFVDLLFVFFFQEEMKAKKSSGYGG